MVSDLSGVLVMVLLPGCVCCNEIECCCEQPKTATVAGATTPGDFCAGLIAAFYDTKKILGPSGRNGDWCVMEGTVVVDEKSGADIIIAYVSFSYPACSGGSEVNQTVRFEITGQWNAVYEKTLEGCPTCDNMLEYVFGPDDVISGDGSYCNGNTTWTVGVRTPCIDCCCVSNSFEHSYTEASCEAAGGQYSYVPSVSCPENGYCNPLP